MSPWYETVKGFDVVPITEDGVDTEAYLEATVGLTKMFELLESQIFGFVNGKVLRDVGTVREHMQTYPGRSSTLEGLISSAVVQEDPEVLISLQKLIRGQCFTSSSLLRAIHDPDDELYTSFQRGYDEVMAPHHTFWVRTAISVGLRAIPTRDTFFTMIADDGPMDGLHEALQKSLEALQVIVLRIQPVLDASGR